MSFIKHSVEMYLNGTLDAASQKKGYGHIAALNVNV